MSQEPEKDLVVLVPGKDEAETLNELLGRHQALRMRPITWQVLRHPDRDAGCRLKAAEFLRHEQSRHSHALVVFDREGCGQDHLPREELEEQVEQALRQSGWGDRAGVVVIDPELEAWVWSDSPEVANSMGWINRDDDLRSWLVAQSFLAEGEAKPARPKEAMDRVLREMRKRRSSAIFQKLAQNVGIQGCEDPAFRKLKRTLRQWFPAETR